MGKEVIITEVNKEGRFVAFNDNGEGKTAEVVLPAKIKWAKLGKAEIGLTAENKINYIRSLEPKEPTNAGTNTGYKKAESKYIPLSTVEILEDVSLKEFQVVYNELNSQQNKKCGASILFRKENGKYDVTLYVTTFELRTPTDNIPTASESAAHLM